MFELLHKWKNDDMKIVAMTDAQMGLITEVDDPVFSQKLMGDGVVFKLEGRKKVICAPASGVLEVLFPTGHAFGIKMKNGVELLVHIGINTVEANGEGFILGDYKQGDSVKAGEPIVSVDLNKLGENYDMSTMLIVTNANGRSIQFIAPQFVQRGQNIVHNR